MALKNHSLDTVSRGTTLEADLDLLSQAELLRLRHEIDIRLNLGKVQDIDLGEELTIQLRVVKALQMAAIDDEEAPFNQQAQTASVVQSLLKDLTRMQTKIHDAEFAKSLEGMLIRAFTKCEAASDPAELKETASERAAGELRLGPHREERPAEHEHAPVAEHRQFVNGVAGPHFELIEGGERCQVHALRLDCGLGEPLQGRRGLARRCGNDGGQRRVAHRLSMAIGHG